MKKTEIITTKAGKIQGYIADGIQIFKGIPYSEPPIGDLRLNAPMAKKPWEGVFEALDYKPISPQPPPYTEYLPLLHKARQNVLISISGHQDAMIGSVQLCFGFMEDHTFSDQADYLMEEFSPVREILY